VLRFLRGCRYSKSIYGTNGKESLSWKFRKGKGGGRELNEKKENRENGEKKSDSR